MLLQNGTTVHRNLTCGQVGILQFNGGERDEFINNLVNSPGSIGIQYNQCIMQLPFPLVLELGYHIYNFLIRAESGPKGITPAGIRDVDQVDIISPGHRLRFLETI